MSCPSRYFWRMKCIKGFSSLYIQVNLIITVRRDDAVNGFAKNNWKHNRFRFVNTTTEQHVCYTIDYILYIRIMVRGYNIGLHVTFDKCGIFRRPLARKTDASVSRKYRNPGNIIIIKYAYYFYRRFRPSDLRIWRKIFQYTQGGKIII